MNSSKFRSAFSELRKYIKIGRARLGGLSEDRDRLGYIGGQGHFNLGDDAMYLSAQHLLNEKNLYSYDHPIRENRLAKLGLSGPHYFSALILGGGTLITPPGCGDAWMAKAEFAISRQVPVWAWGTGVGGCGFIQPDATLPQELFQVLSKFKGIGVRGPRSLEKLKNIGLQRVNIVGDLALGLAREKLSPLSDIPSVAVNLAFPYGDSFDNYPVFKEISKFLSMLDKQGWNIIPVVTDWSDRYPLAELAQRLGKSGWNLELTQSPETFFDLVAGCQFSISVRLHAAVLSCCAGVPPLKIAYRDKCWDFMESMELTDWCVSLEETKASILAEKADWFHQNAASYRDKVLDKSKMWQTSLKSFALEMTSSS